MNDIIHSGTLNDAQRRSLQNVLQSMEQLVERSRSLRAEAQRPGEDGVLIRRHAQLSEPQCAELKLLEDSTMEQLVALRDTFDFHPATQDLRHELHVHFSLLWADLVDEKPEKLVRYGAVDPVAAAVLDPVIDRLAELSEAFAAILQKE